MKVRNLSDDITKTMDATTDEVVALLSEFKKDECWEASFDTLGNPQNTSRDSLGRDFTGNINWFNSLKLNLSNS